MKKTREDYIVDTINYILLAIVGFVTLYPFYYIVVCSFNDGVDLMRGGVYLWPRKFSLASYKQFIEDSSWINAFFVGCTDSGRYIIFGYNHVYFQLWIIQKKLMFRRVYIVLVIITMYFSGGLIPFYVLLRNIGLLNKFWVYIIPEQ